MLGVVGTVDTAVNKTCKYSHLGGMQETNKIIEIHTQKIGRLEICVSNLK